MNEITKHELKLALDNLNQILSSSNIETGTFATSIEEPKQTVKNAIELDPDYAQFLITCPYPGTQLQKEIKQGKWGKFVSNELEEYTTESVTWLPSGYSGVKELEDMQRYAFRKFYLRPSYIFKRILKINQNLFPKELRDA